MLVPQAAAEQTTMQVWIPMVPPGSPDFYDEVEGVVETVTNGQTVLGIRYKASAAPADYYPTQTITVGQNTFRYSLTRPYGASIVDCTMTGCPTATTATCVLIESESGKGLSTATQTVDATDISFGPLSLATPLPDSTTPECGAENADKTKTPSNTETGTGTGASASATGTGGAGSDSAGLKVVGSWRAIAAAAALALAATI
ncbi:hypothetical protein SAPIO_CDS2416 [Scedosporium apiospermum]|uniref:Uncharacterized protein n=1 Tax=Pseudallescheria apiosperma TaxID=563466 RepID=A0A084GCF7_PSEDA|nr:uncharacterized protein SAPIO_CDS2416 [Scedosporium apiospermum]KEZ45019.1 hypothetical protein SAPIO_CDS2416 [Scedosporium apiospermum]